MTMGHFAVALFPVGRGTKAPLWLLLLCCCLPDLLWLLLAVLGIEPTHPKSFLDVSIHGVSAHMYYSHGLVWDLGLAALISLVVFGWRRDRVAALWCGALVLSHILGDYLSGFAHEVMGRGSPKLGLDLYARSPYAAVLIEAVFSAVCVAWYIRHERRSRRSLSRRQQLILYGVFCGGALAFLPTATHSIRQLLSLMH